MKRALLVAAVAASLLASPAGADDDDLLNNPSAQAARHYLKLSLQLDALAHRAGERIMTLEARVATLECLMLDLLTRHGDLEEAPADGVALLRLRSIVNHCP